LGPIFGYLGGLWYTNKGKQYKKVQNNPRISTTGDIMKVNTIISSVIFLTASLICSGGVTASENQSSLSKMAAKAEFLRDQQKNDRYSMYEAINFANDIPYLLMLEEEFAKSPERLQTFLDHFNFAINDEVIPVYKSKRIMVRKDKPFTFSIIAKRGKLESLLALVKNSAQNWINSACVKALNLLRYRISYDCQLQKHNIHDDNTHLMGELIFEHPDMREIIKNPSNILSRIKNYLTWSEWFGLEAKLPELRYQDS
jgi:hypothetical protein